MIDDAPNVRKEDELQGINDYAVKKNVLKLSKESQEKASTSTCVYLYQTFHQFVAYSIKLWEAQGIINTEFRILAESRDFM